MNDARRPTPAWQRWGIRSSLAGLSFFAGLLVVEVWARATYVEMTPLEGPERPLCRSVRDASGLRYELVPARRIQQVLKPWADRPEKRVTYSVNPDGYRGEPVAIPKPEDEYRIVVVGDSFTFGSVVDDTETFPYQLERQLADALPERTVRVVNLGVPGYQIRQERATLELRTLRFEPDLVLLNLYVNDPTATPPTYGGQAEDFDPGPPGPELRWMDRLGLIGGPWEPRPDATWQRRFVAWARERSRIVSRLDLALFRRLSVGNSLRQHRHRWSEGSRGYAKVLETIEFGRDLGEAHGFAFHVSLYPMLERLDAYPLADAHARLALACEERGVPFHDLLPLLEGQPPMALWAHDQDRHPNGTCHGIVAAHLAKVIAPRIP